MAYDELTRAGLERFGFDDPYDPAYIFQPIGTQRGCSSLGPFANTMRQLVGTQ